MHKYSCGKRSSELLQKKFKKKSKGYEGYMTIIDTVVLVES